MTGRRRSDLRSRSPWRTSPSGSTPPLLDSMAAPAVAFSTRLLRTAYSGQCMRVRRSSDSTEQDIGFSGGKLDTAALLSFVGAGDGFVVTWYDQSGNARNATQATAAKQMYVAQTGATIAWGASGDVALLNPGQNRFLTYSLGGGQAPPYSIMLNAELNVAAFGVAWALGGVFWQLHDSAATKFYDGAVTQPTTAFNLDARVLVGSWASGDKRLRSSAGTATTAGTAPSTMAASHVIGTNSDGYGSPQNASYHTCIMWPAALADLDTPYATAAAWL